jgi:hypothetical protein
MRPLLWMGVSPVLCVLCACDVTRLAVPAHPGPTADTAANAALGGRPAVVTFRSGDELTQRNVLVAQFDSQGNLAVGKAEIVQSPPRSTRAFEWERVPRDELVEVSTVDRQRGALKGLGIGAAVGFVATTIAIFVTFPPPSCATPADGSGGLDGSQCPQQNVGGVLALSALVGLAGAVVMGGVGALIGASVGDGADVKVEEETSALPGP